MPKKPEIKKPEPKPLKNVGVVKMDKPWEPTRREVFELFECLSRLQLAKQLVHGVGIFPGEKSESLSRQVAGLEQSIEIVIKQYREEWFKMKGEVEA